MGGLLAFALTLAPLLAMYVYRPARLDTALADERSFLPVLLFKPLPRPVARLEPVVKPAQKARARDLPEPVAADKADERPPALEPAPITVPSTASMAPAAVTPASAALLRLDASVIRNAAQAGKTNLQKMAEASGTYIGDKPQSAAEKMAKGVASTEKPDCMSSKTAGFGLLAVFVIPYQVMADKCK
jgi:hypothetical protein